MLSGSLPPTPCSSVSCVAAEFSTSFSVSWAVVLMMRLAASTSVTPGSWTRIWSPLLPVAAITGSATPSALTRRSSVRIASCTVWSLSWRWKASVIWTASLPSPASFTSQPVRKKSRSRSRMSLTRAGSMPSTAKPVGEVRCTDATWMPLRVAWSRVVLTASSVVALSASSTTTCSTRWIPPRRSRPRWILPGWSSRS